MKYAHRLKSMTANRGLMSTIPTKDKILIAVDKRCTHLMVVGLKNWRSGVKMKFIPLKCVALLISEAKNLRRKGTRTMEKLV